MPECCQKSCQWSALCEIILLKNAKECNNNVIVVEDHYFGGIGPVVSSIVGKIHHLYIKGIPRSGKPKELRKMFKIDAEAIVNIIKKL